MMFDQLLRVGAVPTMHGSVLHDAPCMASCTLPKFNRALIVFLLVCPVSTFEVCMKSGLREFNQTKGKARKSVSGEALIHSLYRAPRRRL